MVLCPCNPELERLMQDDYEFEASLCCIVRLWDKNI